MPERATVEIRKAKRDLARILTIQRERQLKAAKAQAAAQPVPQGK